MRVLALSLSCIAVIGVRAAHGQGGQGANVIPNPAPAPELFGRGPIARPGPTIRPLGMQPDLRIIPIPTTVPNQDANGVYKPGGGVTSPVPLRRSDPQYTPAALREKIQGEVWIDAVVGRDGTVTDARILKSLDSVNGLDLAALETAKKWLFRPGTKDGLPVPVRVTLILEFRLGGPNDVKFPSAMPEGTRRPSDLGVMPPRIVSRTDAKYTADAMRAKIQGNVLVEALVRPDGTVGAARVVESLDKVNGLDEAALDAVRGWKFEPGLYQGQPAPVAIVLTVQFRLH